MALKPVKDTIFKAAPGFNAKAAQEMYDLVMKMDDDEARVFCSIVAADVVEETIEKNLRTVQRQVNKVVAKRLEVIKKATVRAAMTNSKDAVPFAKALSEISKATPYDHGYRFKESDFNRDPGTGRFRAKVTTSQKKPIHDRTAASMGIPTKVAANKATSQKRALSDDRVAAYQDQYRQLANFLGSVASSGAPGDNDVVAHIRDKATGQTYTSTVTSTRPGDVKWDPAREDLVGLDARPNTLTAGGAYFGLSTALGNDGTAQRNVSAVRGINAADSRFGSFSDDWTASYDDRNSNERLYGRISAGSKIAGEIAPNGSKTQLAARMGQFVGDHGSDAEAVFGPTTRKTAYRYRGTSKTPDKAMVSVYDRAINEAKMASATDPYRGTREGRRANLKNPQAMAPVQMAAAREAAKRRNPTWEERNNGRAVIVQHLENKMPKQGLYNLQLASGTTPPSEGVIIDKDGKITNQAVGYGDDHYLPFNLKNLKSLKGGEYIRTRSVGGLTSEDIYTGLMSGAKQVTVTSRSGTFTMTFEDDFKGGRRHNDKARRMTKRYQQILDAVQSEQVDNARVSTEVTNAIRAEVMEEMGGYGVPNKEIAAEVARRVNDFKESPELSARDEKIARFISTQRAQGKQGTDADDYMADVMNELAAEKEYKFRLNGNGYAAALDALREQFPYYMTVKSVPRRHEGRVETEMDRGYVEPGKNRPTYAAAGLYGGAKRNPAMGGGKFSASEADYQGGRGARNGGSGGGSAPSGDGPSGSLSRTDGPKPAAGFKSAVEEAKNKATLATAATAVQEELRTAVSTKDPEDAKLLTMETEQLLRPENLSRFENLIDLAVANNANLNTEKLTKFKQAAGHYGQEPFSPDKTGVWSKKPFAFDEEGLKPGSSASEAARAGAKIDKTALSSVRSEKKLTELDENELKDEFETLTRVRSVLSALGADAPTSVKVEALRELGVQKTPGAGSLLQHPDRINERLVAVHRARALRENRPKGPNGTLMEGDITVTNAPASAEEKLRPQGRAKTLLENFAEAEKYYEAKGDVDALDTINIAAQTLHEEMPRVKSHEDVEDLRLGGHPAAETMKEAEKLVMQMYSERRQGSGGILG